MRPVAGGPASATLEWRRRSTVSAPLVAGWTSHPVRHPRGCLRGTGVRRSHATDSWSSRGTRGPGDRVFGAAWSPDGRQIAIAYGASLTIVPLNGGRNAGCRPGLRMNCITATGRPIAGGLHVCPAIWLSLTRDQETPLGTAFGNIAPSAIVLIPTMGGPSIEIANRTAQNLSPAWSPDSKRLYFVSNRQGIGDIYAVDVSEDGHVRGEAARVTTGLGAQSIAFSTDRRRLAYAAYSARANLWSLPIPSRGPVDISRATPLTSGNQIVEMMRMSPDGKWVLYDSTLHGNADIFRIPTGGGPAERLTTHPGRRIRPSGVARRSAARLPFVSHGHARCLRTAARGRSGRAGHRNAFAGKLPGVAAG